MEGFASYWAGRIFGTNTGNIAIKFESIEDGLKGTLRILDDVYGVAVFEVTGSKGDGIEFHGVPLASVEGVALGDIKARACFGESGELRGEWESTIGTGGTFVVYPHQATEAAHGSFGRNPQTSMVAAPEQIHTHSAFIGALSMSGEDIRCLISDMEKDFLRPRPVVTYSTGKGEVVKFADDFKADLHTAHTLSYLQIQVKEVDANGLWRIVVVELRRHGQNEVRVQGSNESWVIGRVESIATMLNQNRNWLVSSYKRVGGWFSRFLFYCMIVFIVGIESWEARALLAFGVLLFLALFDWVHGRLVPNSVIRLGGFRPTWLTKYWPSVLSWTLTIVSAVLASLIFWKIQQVLEADGVAKDRSGISAEVN